eukprot:6431333-Alexandrium_andersonii.AAC.1
MSASLVGSEMCIRDRFRALYIGWNEHSPIPLPTYYLGSRARQEPRIAPVSYTHLTLPTICSV